MGVGVFVGSGVKVGVEVRVGKAVAVGKAVVVGKGVTVGIGVATDVQDTRKPDRIIMPACICDFIFVPRWSRNLLMGKKLRETFISRNASVVKHGNGGVFPAMAVS